MISFVSRHVRAITMASSNAHTFAAGEFRVPSQILGREPRGGIPNWSVVAVFEPQKDLSIYIYIYIVVV